MEFGSGREGIGTKSLSQSLSDRAPALEHALASEHLGCALERVNALTRGLDLAFPPAPPLAFRGENEGPAFALKRLRELKHERAVARARTHGLQPMLFVPQNQCFDLNAVLADSGIMEIINSIESNHLDKLTRILWLHSPQTKHEYSWLLHIIAPHIIAPITCLPLELLQQILHDVIDEMSDPPLELMHVCKHWHVVVTGIWASLKLGTKTTKDHIVRKLERNQWLLDILVDTEMDRGGLSPSYEAIFTVIEAAARWRSFVVETFPGRADLPEDLVNHGLQKCSNASMNRLRTFVIKCACEMSPLLDRLLHILGSTASSELIRVEINSTNVISFLAPAYPSIFHSIKVLCLDTPGMTEPADLLPHLKQLETFTASQLRLSECPLDVDLPLVHTLSQLKLKGVSIQWMAGRIFHALKSCTLILPTHHHSIHTLGTILPNCEDLTFEGQPLKALEGFSVSMVTRLSVKGQGYNKKYGDKDLVSISKHCSSALALRSLQIGVMASSQAWIDALASMPNLEELLLTHLLPTSLHGGFFEALIPRPPPEDDWNTALAVGKWHMTLFPSLKVFGLWYSRWLRPTEEFELVPTFMAIDWSIKWLTGSLERFHIRFADDQEKPLELSHYSSSTFREAFELMASSIYVKQGQPFNLVGRKGVQKILRHPTASTQRHFLTLPSLVVEKSSKYLPLPSEHDHPGSRGASASYYDSSDDSSDCLPPLGPFSATKDGEDWFALYNPRSPRSLNVSLVFQVNHEKGVSYVRFSKDGLWLATGDNGHATIFDVRTGTLRCTLIDENNTTDILSVCFSPDGKYLATGMKDGLIQIWDIARKCIGYTFGGHRRAVRTLDFSHDGSFIVSGSFDQTVRIWNMNTRESKVFPIANHPGWGSVAGVAVSPDDRFVAAAFNRVVYIWDVETRILIDCLRGHNNWVSSVAFTPDGKGLVSCSLDRTLKYLEFSTALSDIHETGIQFSKCMQGFTGHRGAVSSVAISHDGKWIVSGSDDCGVQFWDRHGRTHLMLQGHHGSVTSVDLSPTGGYLATGSRDGRTRVWRYCTV